ncbi:hypothetical protein ANANG_G00166800 [Anguilla anguilla]|uniref:Uncharacterized protein n=1 Tax=Anguilla anguilla TaxID=7936 RepID=A0A9D3MC81_ANGAN|nr:hypothetical protein ANANG_G00166800 [Anguilla anguilla]
MLRVQSHPAARGGMRRVEACGFAPSYCLLHAHSRHTHHTNTHATQYTQDISVEHLIPKLWALRWSCSPLCHYKASTLLGKLYTRVWNMAAGIRFHSATRALVRMGTDVGQ